MGADTERLEELGDLKNIEKILLSSSKEGLNKYIEIIIYNFEYIIETNYFKSEIIYGNKKCNQFIIKKEDFIGHNNIQIRIKLRDIKLKMIKGINFLVIKKLCYYKKNNNNS